MIQEVLLSIAMGLGLSAACGFRIFVPMLFISIAARTGHLTLGADWMWLASDPALIVFCTATILEICAYYVPVIDHALDIIAAPAAVIAGSVVAAAIFVDMSPLVKWTLAIVAGGGTATAVHVGKTVTRAAVSGVSLGTGNWLVSTGEWILASGMAILSLILPILGILLVLAIMGFAFWVYRHYQKRKNILEVTPA